MNRFIYFFFAIVAVAIDKGNCISCYNCVSKTDPKCLHPSAHSDWHPQKCNPELLVSLAEETKKVAQQLGNAFGIDIHTDKHDLLNIPIVCQKIVTTVGSEKVIVRGCQIGKVQDKDICENLKTKLTTDSSVISHCELCDTDGCNSGYWLAPFSLLSLLVPILGLRMWTMLSA